MLNLKYLSNPFKWNFSIRVGFSSRKVTTSNVLSRVLLNIFVELKRNFEELSTWISCQAKSWEWTKLQNKTKVSKSKYFIQMLHLRLIAPERFVINHSCDVACGNMTRVPTDYTKLQIIISQLCWNNNVALLIGFVALLIGFILVKLQKLLEVMDGQFNTCPARLFGVDEDSPSW